jgi:hypothetical protein
VDPIALLVVLVLSVVLVFLCWLNTGAAPAAGAGDHGDGHGDAQPPGHAAHPSEH